MHKAIAAIIFIALFCSCRISSGTWYSDGQKVKATGISCPRWSTTYTIRGRVVYTDSITGRKMKVVKYRDKNSCFSHDERKRIEITYDSTGKRIGRENVLRQERKAANARYRSCDTCKYTRRKVRTKYGGNLAVH